MLHLSARDHLYLCLGCHTCHSFSSSHSSSGLTDLRSPSIPTCTFNPILQVVQQTFFFNNPTPLYLLLNNRLLAKMRVSTSITTLTLSAVLVIASPIGSRHPPARGRSRCLHPTDAQKIVSKYIAILSHTASDLGDANATAQALLDDNFQEISDSILALKGLPVSSSFDNPLSKSLTRSSSAP